MVELEEKRRAELEDKLQRILEKVLKIHPRLHYVQVFPVKLNVNGKGIPRCSGGVATGCR